MNLFALNGSPLNGGRVAVVSAAAAIACSAAIAASATRIQDALAPASSGASIQAIATATRHASSVVSGSASIVAAQTHSQAASAAISGSVEIQAFVFRAQAADAQFVGQAELQAIPASILGSSNVSAGASLLANATKIQPGKSNAPASGSVVISASPLVDRRVSAVAGGSASLRVEPAYKPSGGSSFIQESYAYIAGASGAHVSSDPVVIKVGIALISPSSWLSGVGTHIKPGFAEAAGVASLVDANLNFQIGGLAHLTCSASVVAQAQHWHGGNAAMGASSSVAAAAKQRHGSAASVMPGSASLSLEPFALRFGESTISVQSDIQADAIRSAEVAASMDGSAFILIGADIERTVIAEVAIPGAEMVARAHQIREGVLGGEPSEAEISVVAQVTRHAAAAPSGELSTTFLATRITLPMARIDCGSSVDAAPSRVAQGLAEVFGGASIRADTIANPASIDPEDRVFNRPAQDSTFLRPPYESEFRRVA